MSTNNQMEQQASITAQVSPDAMGLGSTSGQRTAEIVAGLRYELDNTPLNNALSRFSGRLVARMIMTLTRDKTQVNYILARPASFKHLVKQYLATINHKATLVEIAAGFSPRGLEFAQEIPELQVIEIDLPGVIEDKQRRLEKNDKVNMPANIQWYKADLGVEALSDVLGGEKVDIVCAEGLNPYFSQDEISRIAGHIRASLKPGGVYISDIGWDEGRQAADQNATGLFRRQASPFRGIIKTEEEGKKLFTDVGYDRVEVYRPTKLTAEMQDVPTTPQDYSVIFVAYNPATPDGAAANQSTATEPHKPDTDA